MNSYVKHDDLYIVTPTKHSRSMSNYIPGSAEVYIKMENCQLSGSYKVRGIGRLARKLKEEGCQHLLCSSSGNAGVAASYISKRIDLPCTVYMPETSKPTAIELIKGYGAKTVINGKTYGVTEQAAKKEAEKPGIEYLSPYNHPEIWAGHSTIVDELKTQLPKKPSTIVVAVGGGGLLLGILKGLERVGWKDVPVVGMETIGADCFNLSVKANKVIILDEITSIATCLAARHIAPHLLEVLPEFNVISEVIPDAQAVDSCIKFANEERVLVEPGCGAALSAIYCGVLEKLQAEGSLPSLETGPVVVIVCGGNGVSLSLLKEWTAMFDIQF